MAQTVHRIDMRLKLGLLRDTAAIEERAAKEAAEAAARRHRSKVPTAKTEAEIQVEKEATEEAKKKTYAGCIPASNSLIVRVKHALQMTTWENKSPSIITF